MFGFINNYDLFIFDLDGCLIDSENVHYKSYNIALKQFNIEIPFSYCDYTKLLHSCDSLFKDFIAKYVDYDTFYRFKETVFESLKHEIAFIPGANDLLQLLLDNEKHICIVTNSSTARTEIIKDQFPLLKKVIHWVTKEDCSKMKPNPECYIKAINFFTTFKILSNKQQSIDTHDMYAIPFHRIIAFEDSFKGFMALNDLPIEKILIQSPSYYYYDAIDCLNKYIDFYNIKNITNPTQKQFVINNKIYNYITQINEFSASLEYIVNMITPMVKTCTGTIYLLGIGKSRYVCNKCVSTWQSLGIHASSLVVQDLFHGDFGILKKDDIVIYISNSGNTDELLSVAKYIKEVFQIFQISISNNKDNSIKNYTNMDFTLGNKKIIEADNINFAPSISSCIFMMTLDLIGIRIAEMNDMLISDFKKNHPGGTLGKK
jgi:D-arabinose 5-phosphate isomerase GutQ/beta-phosphoglucomutase-like phosphatase (HAD superfamily)